MPDDATRPSHSTDPSSTAAERTFRSTDRFVQLHAGSMHVVLDGDPHAPAVLLVHGSGASVGWWEPIVEALAATRLVIRVDLLGYGRSSVSSDGYGIPSQAQWVGEALDRLGVTRVTAVGHSMGCLVVTSLAEQRAQLVAGVALIDMGPNLDSQLGGANPLSIPVLGRLVWALSGESLIRKALSTAITRDVEVPRELVLATKSLTYEALAETDKLGTEFMAERDLPSRLAPLGVPVLVIFGEEDRRYRSRTAVEYFTVPGARVEMLPGVGHTPMLEDPATTARLLGGFLDEVERH